MKGQTKITPKKKKSKYTSSFQEQNATHTQ